MDFQTVAQWRENELDKTVYGRMPWHDVAFGVIGDCVYDIAEHFVLRWNHVKRDKYKRDPRVDWILMQGRPDEALLGVQRPRLPVGHYITHPRSSLSSHPRGTQGTVHGQVIRSSADWSSGILVEHSIQNAYIDLIERAQHYVYIENQFFITSTGSPPIGNMIGRAIIDACVRASKEGRRFRVIILIPSIPGFVGDLRSSETLGTRAIMEYQYRSICRGDDSIMAQIAKEGVDPHNHIFFFNLRSYDRINRTPDLLSRERNTGVKYTQAQRTGAQDIMPEGIANHTDKDHHHAHHRHFRKATFREKEAEQKADVTATAQRQRAELEHEAPSADSVSGCALDEGRHPVSAEVWEGDPEMERENYVQEELYIHGKVMLVDDRYAICGSANINDRSQLGTHDSELAIAIRDTASVPGLMDGQPYDAGPTVSTLRRQLWREHLGIAPEQPLDASNDPNAKPPGDAPNVLDPNVEHGDITLDPLSDELWNTWTTQATTNTNIFRRLFRADPDDNVHTFAQLDEFLPDRRVVPVGHLADPYIPVEEVKRLLDQIRGHLVWMPLRFLDEEKEIAWGLTVNYLTEVSVVDKGVVSTMLINMQSIYM